MKEELTTEQTFKDLGDAARKILAISGAAYINDRKLTPREYRKIKEATVWIIIHNQMINTES